MEDSGSKDYLQIKNKERYPVRLEALFAPQGLSRNAFIEVYRTGLASLKGKVLSRNAKVPPGGEVRLAIEDEPVDYRPERIPMRVHLEDAHFLIVDKPEGIPMLPQQGREDGSLANRVQGYYEVRGLHRKVRFVNRIDQGTSGIVVIAKHKYAQAYLQKQMDAGEVEKHYLVVAEGEFLEEEGKIEKPLFKDPDSHRRIAHADGARARTDYRVIGRTERGTLLYVTLHTGRTHQIRAHLAEIGHPIVGDTLYGANASDRIYLHSFSFAFRDWEGRKRLIRSLPDAVWGLSDADIE